MIIDDGQLLIENLAPQAISQELVLSCTNLPLKPIDR